MAEAEAEVEAEVEAEAPQEEQQEQQEQSTDLTRRVFFGNLPWRTRWQDLKDWLKENEFNATFTNIGRDRRTNKSKGFGLAEFATLEEAQQVVEKLNNLELDGRKIYVREDRGTQPPAGANRNRREQQQDDNAGDGETAQAPKKVRSPGVATSGRVYVGNLAWSVKWKELVDHMSTCGEVVFAEILTGVRDRSMGCAIVMYKTIEEAQKAVDQLTDTSINDRKIFVREDRETNFCVFINRIPSKMTWQDLKDMCSEYGKVVRSDRNSKGYGTVKFETQEEAQACIDALSGKEYMGQSLEACFVEKSTEMQRKAEEEPSVENKTAEA